MTRDFSVLTRDCRKVEKLIQTYQYATGSKKIKFVSQFVDLLGVSELNAHRNLSRGKIPVWERLRCNINLPV